MPDDDRTEIERLSVLNDAVEWDQQGGGNHVKAYVDAFMTPGERVHDIYMRGIIPAEYLPSVIRQTMRGLEAVDRKRMQGEQLSLDKDTDRLTKLPNALRQVELFVRFSPAVEGRARGELLSAFTGGMFQIGNRAKGGLSRLFKGRKKSQPSTEMAG